MYIFEDKYMIMLKTNWLFTFILIILPMMYLGSTNDTYWKEKITEQNRLLDSDINKSILIGNDIIKNCKNDSIKAHSYYMLGTAYINKGDYIKAFKYSYKAKDLITTKSHNLRFLIYNNIGLSNIYKRIGLIDRAKEELEHSKKLVDKIDSKNYYSKAILNLAYGNLLCNLGKHTSAIPIYIEAETLLKKITEPRQINDKNRLLSIVYSDISNIHLINNDLKNAENYIQKAIKTLGNVKSFDAEYINTVTLAEIYTKTNRDQQSIQLLLPLVDHPNIEPVFNQLIHQLLADSYKKIGETNLYLLKKKKADSIQSTFSNQQTTGLKEAYKFIENDLNEKENQHNNLKIFLIIVIITSLLLMFLGVKSYKAKINKEKEAYQALINTLDKQKKPSPKKSEDNSSVEFTKSELELLEKLDNFELQKGYLKKDLSLAVLAVELNTNASYLSDIINKSKNKNINTYINELRINYITKELYTNPALLNYKISYLAEISGFNSHNSFTLVFKKITNISPSVFLDERRKELSENKLQNT